MHASPEERFPVYSLFSDFGSKILEEVPCQIGCLVSCVLMLCLCRNYFWSLTTEEAQTELYDAKLRHSQKRELA